MTPDQSARDKFDSLIHWNLDLTNLYITKSSV